MKKFLSFAGVALLALIGVVGCDDDTVVTPVAPPPTPAPIFGTVSGTVSVEGSGLAGVSVNLSGAASQSASTGGSGGYSFDNVPAGTHSVQISGAPDEVTFGSTATAVTITTSGQAATADFSGTYIRTARITGSVTAGGEGVVATVTATGAGMLMSQQAVLGSSGTDGNFELPGLRAGTYTVAISDFGDHEFVVTSRAVTVVVGQSVSVAFVAEAVEVTTGSITGQVVTAAGVGIVATVTAVGTGEDGVTVAGSSDTEGDYELPGVEAGDYTVTISEFSDDHEFTVSSRAVTVVAGQSSSVTFVAGPEPEVTTGSITGQVVTAAGVGIVATVTAVGTGEDGVTVAGSSDTEGDYELPGVEAGDYTVTISEFSDDHEFDVSSRTVTVVAGQSSSVSFVAEDVPTTGTGTSLSVIITDITDDIDDDGKISGRVTVTIDVERGEFEKIALYVNAAEVDAQLFGLGPAPAGEPPLAAQQGVMFKLSFNSAKYDPDTGVVTYPNAAYEIVAGVTVQGSTEAYSNRMEVEFANGDGVHVYASAPSPGKLDSQGNVWYGGPGTTLEIRAVPVVYSGGSASAVTLKKFCGADAATSREDDADPFEFTPDCEGKGMTSEGVSPTFTLTVGGESIDIGVDDILNAKDDIFPINLDYEGPGSPWFMPNPNKREGGWINDAVQLTAEHKTTGTKNLDGWLFSGDSEGGVGGYTRQLRSAAAPSGKDGLEEAIAATAYPSPTLPAASKKATAYCFVASAVDALGNESKRPDPEKDGSCMLAGTASQEAMDMNGDGDTEDEGEAAVLAGGYMELVEILDAVEKDDEAGMTDAIAALANAGIRAGVDKTPPTVVFASGSPTANDKDLTTNFIVHVAEEEDGSQLHSTPVTARLEVRNDDDKGMVCAPDNADGPAPGKTSMGECKSDVVGLDAENLPLVVVTNSAPQTVAGYYTLTAQAKDKAGNKSTAISRVALHDTEVPVAALIVTEGKDVFNYNKILVAADALSIRDYTVTMGDATGLPADTEVRLGTMKVGDYNGSLLKSRNVSGPIELPFIAVQGTNADGIPGNLDEAVTDNDNAIKNITAYVTDQAGNSHSDVEEGAVAVTFGEDVSGGAKFDINPATEAFGTDRSSFVADW